MLKNLQSIFNKIIDHLDKQKEKSIENNQCFYRGPNNLKCAVGALIEDKHYYEDLETLPAHNIEVSKCLVLSGIDAYNSEISRFLSDCQWVHDTKPIEKWNEQFKQIASKYKLDFDESKLNF